MRLPAPLGSTAGHVHEAHHLHIIIELELVAQRLQRHGLHNGPLQPLGLARVGAQHGFEVYRVLVAQAQQQPFDVLIVNGRVLMHDRVVKTLQAPAVLAEAQRMAARVRTAIQ